MKEREYAINIYIANKAQLTQENSLGSSQKNSKFFSFPFLLYVLTYHQPNLNEKKYTQLHLLRTLT